MIGNIVSRRYAKALFELGQSLGLNELQSIGASLESIRAVLRESPELKDFLGNPIFTTEEKRAVLTSIFEKIDISKIVQNFSYLLADKGRLSEFDNIISEYSAMLDVENGLVRGEMITAIDLTALKQEKIKGQLESQSGKKIALAFKVDKSIIGGLILKIYDWVLDGSLKAQINILKENIKRGE